MQELLLTKIKVPGTDPSAAPAGGVSPGRGLSPGRAVSPRQEYVLSCQNSVFDSLNHILVVLSLRSN